MDIWIIFYAIVVSQGFFISFVLLLSKKGNRKANYILSILVLFLTFYLLDNLLGMTDFFKNNPHFLHIVTPMWYLFPPLSFFYVKMQTNPQLKWNWIYILHFIPFLIVLQQFLPFYGLPGEIKLKYFTGEIKAPGDIFVRAFYSLLWPGQLIFYTSLILLKLLKENKELPINKAHKSWLRMVFFILFFFAAIEFVLIVKWIFTQQITIPFKYIPLAFFSLIIYSIAYLAIVQPETLFSFGILKIKKINLDKSKQYADELKILIENEKLYLNSELKYSEIASRLGISARYLTQILNQEIGKGFNDFINEYRIKEVQKRIISNDVENVTLFAIALESGFNNKSSFNRIFKKHTGITPTEFIYNMKNSASQKVS